MDETAARATRRAALRALPTPTDLHLEPRVDVDPPLLDVIDDLHAPATPRVPELDALLREVDDLRATIRRDLTLAATAAEAGADDLAGWLLLGSDGAVRRFEDSAQAHLAAAEVAELAQTVPAPRRRSRLLPAAPMVAAAAALFGFLTGVVPGALNGGITSPETSNAAALNSYAQLARLATSGASDSTITAAAQRFHNDLAPLVAAAGTNPAAAEKAIALLQSEHAVISSEGADSPALRAVLAQADALVRKLQATLPRHRVRTPVVVPLPQPQDEPRRQPAQQPKDSTATKAAPSPSASAKPSAKPTPSSASTASPKPSPTADSGPLPQSPYTLPG